MNNEDIYQSNKTLAGQGENPAPANCFGVLRFAYDLNGVQIQNFSHVYVDDPDFAGNPGQIAQIRQCHDNKIRACVVFLHGVQTRWIETSRLVKIGGAK